MRVSAIVTVRVKGSGFRPAHLAGLRRELGGGVDTRYEEELGALLADAVLDPDLHAVALVEAPADVQARLLEHLRVKVRVGIRVRVTVRVRLGRLSMGSCHNQRCGTKCLDYAGIHTKACVGIR